MFNVAKAITVAITLVFGGVALADTTSITHGRDTYVAGAQINEAVDSAGDTFLAGRTIQAGGTTSGDLHVSGFDLSINTDTAQDLYAAGAFIEVSGTVAQDLTAAGFSLRTERGATTGGNARLFGNSVTIEGPVEGALMVTGRDVILNAPVTGDARILAQTLTFGPEAVVQGTLTYSTPDSLAVPQRVAPDVRVVFEAQSTARIWDELDEISQEIPAVPTFGSMLFGFVISLLFFLVLGALMLSFMPKRLAKLRRSIADAPGQTILLGVIGLSILMGLLPITAMTIVGIPFVLIVILAIVVVWTLGYALGAYGIAMRIWLGFGGDDNPSKAARLAVFAAAIIFVALLNFIPFVGWIANYTLVLLGVGSMTRALFHWLIGNPDVAFDVDMKPIDD